MTTTGNCSPTTVVAWNIGYTRSQRVAMWLAYFIWNVLHYFDGGHLAPSRWNWIAERQGWLGCWWINDGPGQRLLSYAFQRNQPKVVS